MEANLSLPERRGSAVRAEVGRLPGRARERRRRARAVVAQGAPAARYFGAEPAQGPASPLRARRRDRDRARRRARLRADADAAAPRRATSTSWPPHPVHRVRSGRARPITSCRSRSAARSSRRSRRALGCRRRPRPGARFSSIRSRPLDGVIAKRLDLPYRPGSREAAASRPRTAHRRSALEVEAHAPSRRCSWLYRDDATTWAPPRSARRERAKYELVEPLKNTPKRRASEPNTLGHRRPRDSRSARTRRRGALRQGNRFHHGTQLIRFREDAKDCTWRDPRRNPRTDVGVAARLLNAI